MLKRLLKLIHKFSGAVSGVKNDPKHKRLEKFGDEQLSELGFKKVSETDSLVRYEKMDISDAVEMRETGCAKSCRGHVIEIRYDDIGDIYRVFSVDRYVDEVCAFFSKHQPPVYNVALTSDIMDAINVKIEELQSR